MKEERLTILFEKYITNNATAEEEMELFRVFAEPDMDDKKKLLIADAYDKLPASFAMSDEQAQFVFQQIMAVPAPSPKIYTFWRSIAVAASILLFAGVAGYFFLSDKDVDATQVVAHAVVSDVEAPKAHKAMITLADGQKIPLDSLNKGVLSLQNGISVEKTTDGQILYKGNSSITAYNTLINPRGSKAVSLILSDGSKIWLNCESSVRYPISFSNKERKIEITGEAYFEVASVYEKGTNKKIPFTVHANKVAIQVLGTHFNVNAYKETDNAVVTLIEGSVKINNNNTSGLLAPGQQAKLQDGGINIESNANIDAAMSWKNGKFQFGEKANIKTIMQEISRWYNIDVEYDGNIDVHFGGSISRDVNLSQIIKIIEGTGNVRFTLKDTKLIVSPIS